MNQDKFNLVLEDAVSVLSASLDDRLVKCFPEYIERHYDYFDKVNKKYILHLNLSKKDFKEQARIMLTYSNRGLISEGTYNYVCDSIMASEKIRCSKEILDSLDFSDYALKLIETTVILSKEKATTELNKRKFYI